MTRGRQKPVEPVLSLAQARQMLKVCTVILRDHSHLTYHDVSLEMAYCWAHTETEEMARKRELEHE